MLGELKLPECSHVRLLMLPVDTPAMAGQPSLVASFNKSAGLVGSVPTINDPERSFLGIALKVRSGKRNSFSFQTNVP